VTAELPPLGFPDAREHAPLFVQRRGTDADVGRRPDLVDLGC
jgi:hypothetical protein